jgi:hypothetical protein
MPRDIDVRLQQITCLANGSSNLKIRLTFNVFVSGIF